MPALTRLQDELADASPWDFSGLSALFVNCTLKRSPAPSHTMGPVSYTHLTLPTICSV